MENRYIKGWQTAEWLDTEEWVLETEEKRPK